MGGVEGDGRGRDAGDGDDEAPQDLAHGAGSLAEGDNERGEGGAGPALQMPPQHVPRAGSIATPHGGWLRATGKLLGEREGQQATVKGVH